MSGQSRAARKATTLNDREFIRAFQVLDRVIQNRQPLFMLVWVGSVVALVPAACARHRATGWS